MINLSLFNLTCDIIQTSFPPSKRNFHQNLNSQYIQMKVAPFSCEGCSGKKSCYHLFCFSSVKMISQMVMVMVARKLWYIYKIWELMPMMITLAMVMMMNLMLMMVWQLGSIYNSLEDSNSSTAVGCTQFNFSNITIHHLKHKQTSLFTISNTIIGVHDTGWSKETVTSNLFLTGPEISKKVQ